MDRRSFIKGLIALATAPAIGKFVNVFKTEGARKGIENVASQGVDFFNMVIKKVMNEGKLVNESDRIQTFKHPDRPDITVDVDLNSGSSSVYFDTDQGSKAAAEITKTMDETTKGRTVEELMESEEVYKMGGDEYYKDIQEGITGGVGSLEEWIKMKRGYAAGGRVGFSGGGIFRGLKGIQLGKVQKDLIKKYKDQGMDFIEAVTKGTDEGNQLVNKKKLDFLKTKFDDTNVYSDDYVKLIDEEIRINDPELFQDIRQFELNGRPELADKMRALRHPDWAEANFGEDYLTVLENRQVQGINRMMEDIDPNIQERSVLDDIDDMNKANIDDLFGRKKNADGGRVGRWMGGPLSAGKSTLREMLRHFSKGSSHGKSGAEMLKMVNPKQISKYLEDPNLLFMKGSPKEGLMATDMIKDYATKVEGERAMMINELLEAAKNIRKADKSIEQYRMEMIEAMMAKGADRQMAENLAKMVSGMAEGAAGKKPTPKLTDEGILQLENIYKNLITKDRSLNADGGRVGMFRGGVPKGLAAALRAIMGKYGDDAITTADKAPQPEKTIQEQIMDFNARTKSSYKPGDAITSENFESTGFAPDLSGLEKAKKLGLSEYPIWENPEKVREAVDDIFPTGDYKYDAQMAAEALVENNPDAFANKLFDDLDQRTQMKVYGAVVDVVQQDLAKMLQLKRATKPEKTLAALKAGKGIDMSDPDIAAEFTRFMQESDPKGFKDVEEKVELMNFNPKGRKKNADGGSVGEDVNLTVIQIPDISQSGVESLFKRR